MKFLPYFNKKRQKHIKSHSILKLRLSQSQYETVTWIETDFKDFDSQSSWAYIDATYKKMTIFIITYVVVFLKDTQIKKS